MATVSHSFWATQFPVRQYSFFPNVRKFNIKVGIIGCLSLNQPTFKTTNGSATGGAAPEPLKVLLVAGGTGGRISPAIAIADELKTLKPETEILFVGTPAGMESVAVPSAGYSFQSIPATPPSGNSVFSLNSLFSFPYHLFKSLSESFQILEKFGPGIVIGTGGYVSFPICLAAALKGIKLVIQEQNSVPGTTNLLLSLFSERVFVAFNSSLDYFWQKDKCVVCGNPIRSSLQKYVSKVDARKHFFPEIMEKEPRKTQGKVILVLGGSLGAHPINVHLFNLYKELINEHEDLFIIWQTGFEAFDEMYSLVRKHPRVIIKSFFQHMHLAYAAADLIISRAGAMTCAEILATGKPCILIPSPRVAEGHQVQNAHLMADLAGSRVITEDELDSSILRTAIEEILGNESLMEEMSTRALHAVKLNAANRIAKHILSLIRLPK